MVKPWIAILCGSKQVQLLHLYNRNSNVALFELNVKRVSYNLKMYTYSLLGLN